MATYRMADNLKPLIASCMEKYHPALNEAGVRVGARYAHAPRDEESGEPKGPALKLHGYPCLATVKIVSHKDRVAGLPDAIIDVDGDRWDDLSDAQQRALIDHELTRLELALDEEGKPKLDDCHRPKLKMRQHDHEVGVFNDVVRRHGPAAPESAAFAAAHRDFVQRQFPWGSM